MEKFLLCHICGKRYSHHHYLKMHLFKHKRDKNVACDVCHKEFFLFAELIQHLNTHKEKFICKLCHKTFFMESYFLLHVRSHIEKLLLCHVCGKVFSYHHYLKMHLKMHAREKMFLNDIIIKPEISVQQVLNQPFDEDHTLGRSNSWRGTVLVSSSDGISSTRVTFGNPGCSAPLESNSTPDPTIIIDKFESDEFRPESSDESDALLEAVKQNTGQSPYKPIMDATGRKRFLCIVCERPFIKTSCLNQHLRTHWHRKPLTCETCHEIFSNVQDLIRHAFSKGHTHHPENEKTFVCDICRETFSEKSTLTLHFCVHTGEKPLICNICKKACAQKSVMKSHFRICHPKKKFYLCNVCKEIFSAKRSLYKHTCYHTGRKPFICDVCNNTYAAENALNVHRMTHVTNKKRFICDVCNRTFNHEKAFLRHCFLHKAIKTVSCELCHERFSDKNDLKDHYLIHESRESFSDPIVNVQKLMESSIFECNFCQRIFSEETHLIQHICDHTEQVACKLENFDDL